MTIEINNSSAKMAIPADFIHYPATQIRDNFSSHFARLKIITKFRLWDNEQKDLELSFIHYLPVYTIVNDYVGVIEVFFGF